MLPTPDTSHVDISRIYEPAEDSFLFLDTLSSVAETAYLPGRLRGTPTPLVVEVGTGSGVILAFLVANRQAILGHDDILAIGIDVNKHACQAAAETISKAVGQSSNVRFDTVRADLLSSLRPGTIDVLLFNPPYVPTPSLPTIAPPQDANEDAFGEDCRLLELSYAGGDDGMEVTHRFLQQLPNALSLHGVAYLLLCQQNKPLQVTRDIEARGIFEACIVGTSGKSGGWERLCILRITRKTVE